LYDRRSREGGGLGGEGDGERNDGKGNDQGWGREKDSVFQGGGGVGRGGQHCTPIFTIFFCDIR